MTVVPAPPDFLKSPSLLNEGLPPNRVICVSSWQSNVAVDRLLKTPEEDLSRKDPGPLYG